MRVDNAGPWLMANGLILMLIGSWWLALPGTSQVAVVFLVGGALLLAGGSVKWRADRRRRTNER
ncbi:hypothetical protein I6N91_15535 [Arthrobacter sp. MSA 4-2]|uniref:hypothetical protein n=1 Tax=Arthrobacter sp. MSA 4-2 TaxID=2794349 RepID=UPI0018E74BD2|nr:hypothetical protein [Arthrobacter sp. MSA 4-2]MBJ2122392.1 hypothetical protein [Arthrobacter sp. MSA 4-2]